MPEPRRECFELDITNEFLVHNLNAIGVEPETRARVLEAEPAELVPTPAAFSLVRREGVLLGAPADEHVVRKACRASDGQPVVVFGLGTGDTVRVAREFARGAVVAFEPDPGIARAVLSRGPSDLGDVDLVCSLDALARVLPPLARGATSATVVQTPGYAAAFPNLARELGETLHQALLRIEMNNNTHRARSHVWVRDLLSNVELLADAIPFLALEGRFRGVPAFIVGAGPSLEKNSKLLAEAARRGLVFATNSSSRALDAVGVKPQILCCIESIDQSHLLRDVSFIDDVVRAFSLSGHPNTLRTGKGPLLPIWEALHDLAEPMRRLTGLPGLPVCGSVSTIAFSLAHRLGCSPIVLVGQDLAYTNNRTHAAGTAFAESRIRMGEGGAIEIDWCDTYRATRSGDAPKPFERELSEIVRAWGGEGSVTSSPSFGAVREWFEAAAQTLSDANDPVRLVNASEGGSRIRGFSELRLAELLETLPEHVIEAKDLAEAARKARSPFDAEQLAAWAEAEQDGANEVVAAARRLRKDAENARTAVTRGSASDVAHAFERLERSERGLRDAATRAPMVQATAFAAIDAIGSLPAVEDDAHAQAIAGAEHEARLAGAVERAAGELDALLSPLVKTKRRRNVCPS